jgi:hypothetical protein
MFCVATTFHLFRADETVFNAAGLRAMQALRPLHLERKSATG